MTEGDDQRVRAERHIFLPGAIRRARKHTAAHMRHVHRQHFTDVALLDQLA